MVTERESVLVERVLTRYRRPEVSAEIGAWPAAPAVPRVLSRPTTVAGGSGRPAGEPSSFTGPTFWDQAPPPTAPQVDVARLTDQVIRSLDERVIAARERRIIGKA